jgi:hypothetical protein
MQTKLVRTFERVQDYSKASLTVTQVTIVSLLTLGSLVLADPAPTAELVQKRDGPNYFVSSVAVKNRSTFTPDNFTGLYMDTVDNHAVLKNSTSTPNAKVSPSTTRPWYLDPTNGTIKMANSDVVLNISNEGGVINVDGNSNMWSTGFFNDNGV